MRDIRAKDQRTAVTIMAKASVPGMCKTRLVPPLTFEQAASLNTAFLLDIAANIAAAAKTTPILGLVAYQPREAHAFFASLLPAEFCLLAPREEGLGVSLSHAMRDLIEAGFQGACLVNGDSPTLPTAHLLAAIRALAEPGDRVVLGPAADGGYWLIGLKWFHPRLFQDIAWSTERVFAQTCDRAREIGLPVALAPPWYDVDDSETLTLLRFELSGENIAWRGGNPAPATRAFFAALAAAETSA